MGRAVSQVLDARDDVVVAARFDWGETADISLCDVIIDFSTPDASVALAQAAAARGAPALVIGSALAGAVQVLVPRSALLAIGSNPALSIVAMILLGSRLGLTRDKIGDLVSSSFGPIAGILLTHSSTIDPQLMELVGPVLILTGRLVWLGAGMLGVFTLLAAFTANALHSEPVYDSLRARCLDLARAASRNDNNGNDPDASANAAQLQK